MVQVHGLHTEEEEEEEEKALAEERVGEVGVGGGQGGKSPPLKIKPYVVKYEFQNSLMYCVPPLKPKIGLLLAHVWGEFPETGFYYNVTTMSE